jgi:hypothetical protein
MKDFASGQCDGADEIATSGNLNHQDAVHQELFQYRVMTKPMQMRFAKCRRTDMANRTLIKKSAFAAALAAAPWCASADEGGVSFWLPGQFSSFAATPGEPGWSLPMIYYHTTADESGGVTTQRGGRITAGADARADLLFAFPTYVFEKPVWGGQVSLSAGAAVAHMIVSVQATLAGLGGATLSGAEKDTLTGVSDVVALGTLKWNRGVHNTMAYAMSSLPAGSYETGRLANLGLNHWSLDAGGGYTYLDTKKEHELSAVLGFTYNFENHDTDYKNGVDAHLDWAASQFLSERTQVGLVGYFYQQVTGDSGAGARLGDYKSRVAGIGPQAGYFFKVGDRKWYANLKGYHEFNARNRPEGWNVWLTLAIPLGSTKSQSMEMMK